MYRREETAKNHTAVENVAEEGMYSIQHPIRNYIQYDIERGEYVLPSCTSFGGCPSSVSTRPSCEQKHRHYENNTCATYSNVFSISWYNIELFHRTGLHPFWLDTYLISSRLGFSVVSFTWHKNYGSPLQMKCMMGVHTPPSRYRTGYSRSV